MSLTANKFYALVLILVIIIQCVQVYVVTQALSKKTFIRLTMPMAPLSLDKIGFQIKRPLE